MDVELKHTEKANGGIALFIFIYLNIQIVEYCNFKAQLFNLKSSQSNLPQSIPRHTDQGHPNRANAWVWTMDWFSVVKRTQWALPYQSNSFIEYTLERNKNICGFEKSRIRIKPLFS